MRYYAMYIPTGDVVDLVCSNRNIAEQIIKEADFYYTRSQKKLCYTFYKKEMMGDLSNYVREYIDKKMNSTLIELIEKR